MAAHEFPGAQVGGSSMRASPTKWSYVGVPLKLFGTLILGGGTAVAQHFLYKSLNGTAVDNEAWILRGGNAMSYAVKIMFAFSITMCLKQLAWKQLRAKSWTMGAVDDLTGMWFFRLQFLTRAPVIITLAVLLASLPLIPIIIPASLSLTQATLDEELNDVQALTLNVSRTRQNLFASGETLGYTVNIAEINGVGAADNGYFSPSSQATGLVYNTVYGGQIVQSDSPCGANCTFNQTFFGPAYSCDDIDFTQNDISGDPFPYGSNGTAAFVPLGPDQNFVTWYQASNSTCDADDCPQDPWRDGKIWVWYQYLLPEYRNNSPEANYLDLPDSAWERHQLLCQSYNASYNVQRTYIGFQESVVGGCNLLNPLNYSIDVMNGEAYDDMSPEYAGYAIHQTLYSILSGEIGPDGRFVAVDTTGLAGTKLVEAVPFPLLNASDAVVVNRPGDTGIQKPVQNLAQAIESLHVNITIGMLSIPNLIYLQNETVSATGTSVVTQWSYNYIPLAVTYGAFFAANLLAAVLAVSAIVDNGGIGISHTGFLRTLLTTRNADLDRVAGGMGRGEDYQQSSLKDVLVRFGRLSGSDGAQSTGFALKERDGKA